MKRRGEKITHISELFEKYRAKLKPPQRTIVDEFRKIVHTVVGIEIEDNHCSYSPHSRTLVLNIPGPTKTEILLKKEKLLEELHKSFGAKNTPKQIL